MKELKETLLNGGIILTPTDTTFGLSCIATNQKAVEKIFAIKKRSLDKKLILLVDNAGKLQRYVDVPDLAWDLIDLSEKPITIVYHKVKDLPDYLLNADGSIAIRLVEDNFIKRIVGSVKEPLISTSVNFSNTPPPQSYDEIPSEITEAVDYIVPESLSFTPLHAGSTIISLGINNEIKIIRA